MKHILSALSLTLAATSSSALSRLACDPIRPANELRVAWVGKLEVGPIHPVLQFRIVETEAGETVAFFDSITEGQTDFDANWAIDAGQLRFDVPGVGATYRGQLNALGDTAEGRFEQGGRGFELTLRRQVTAYNAQNTWENRPQRPQAPFPYTSEDVTFENRVDQATLAGTLTLPAEPGKHPVVVLISGSGPQDRDETLLGHKPFLVLADYLGRRGIAMLRYDDRGTASSSGDFASATTEDFARDVVAALDFLEQHDRIDSGRMGLVGHSEGGLVAPIVAAERNDVALIVLLAAPGVLGETIARTQAVAMSRAQGNSEEDLELLGAIHEALFTAVKDAKPGVDVQGAIERAIAQAVSALPEPLQERAAEGRDAFRTMLPTYSSPWFRFFLLHDPRPTLERLSCPVLALNGEKDIQVLPKLNLPAIEAALLAGGNQDFEVLELARLNHLFQECETGSISEYISIQETINEAALEKIGSWIGDRIGAGHE